MIPNILHTHGKQFIPDLSAPKLPEIFRGRPVIDEKSCETNCKVCIDECPTEAILSANGKIQLDLGKCIFCNECVQNCPSQKIKFTNDYKIATNVRNRLIVQEGKTEQVALDPEIVRKEIISFFGQSLKLRQVSAGGDNADEMELNAATNVNFDMGRFGIDWVASPRHADGIVITGPISENMALATQICYDAVPNPKIVILAGTNAISGGLFQNSNALNRSFLENIHIDLYVPGYPVHPLTFINGILEMINHQKRG